VRCFDAHNHLQDDRFLPVREGLVEASRAAGVCGMVVNGACESDWDAVERWAEEQPGWVKPSFGWHPWYLHERLDGWEGRLEQRLLGRKDAGVGECGLDQWILSLHPEARAKYVPALRGIEPASLVEQETVLRVHLELAHQLERPLSLHCLGAWGRLLDILREGPLPACGFLLHSYGGSIEMMRCLAGLGGYFSFPGYFLHERKQRQREVFRHVPSDRLLVETDAPDQLPPEEFRIHPLEGPNGPMNHPANLARIQQGLAKVLGMDEEVLSARLETNYRRLFGGHR